MRPLVSTSATQCSLIERSSLHGLDLVRERFGSNSALCSVFDEIKMWCIKCRAITDPRTRTPHLCKAWFIIIMTLDPT